MAAPISTQTLLYKFLYTMYGTACDELELAKIHVINDAGVYTSRDEALYDNFGQFFNFPQPQTLTNVQYRRCLQLMMKGALLGGTINAINGVVLGFTGVLPTIVNTRDTLSFFIGITDPGLAYFEASDLESEFDVNYLVDSGPSPAVISGGYTTTYLDDGGSPPVVIARQAAAFGIEIFINNPGAFTLDHAIITRLINQITPAHVNAVVSF